MQDAKRAPVAILAGNPEAHLFPLDLLGKRFPRFRPEFLALLRRVDALQPNLDLDLPGREEGHGVSVGHSDDLAGNGRLSPTGRRGPEIENEPGKPEAIDHPGILDWDPTHGKLLSGSGGLGAGNPPSRFPAVELEGFVSKCAPFHTLAFRARRRGRLDRLPPTLFLIRARTTPAGLIPGPPKILPQTAKAKFLKNLF